MELAIVTTQEQMSIDDNNQSFQLMNKLTSGPTSNVRLGGLVVRLDGLVVRLDGLVVTRTFLTNPSFSRP